MLYYLRQRIYLEIMAFSFCLQQEALPYLLLSHYDRLAHSLVIKICFPLTLNKEWI